MSSIDDRPPEIEQSSNRFAAAGGETPGSGELPAARPAGKRPITVRASEAAEPVAATTLGTLALRKDIRNLDPNELETVRRAFTQLFERAGASGYQEIAGIHGEPRWLCPHGDILFVPWHRAYVIMLERALREDTPDAVLPFWDWASSRSQRRGIPVELRAEPLDRAFIALAERDTNRAPGPLSQLRQLARQVASALDSDSFEDFSGLIEAPHNLLHVWVGGDMQSVRYAAYDPIFWMHHTNVDRQWALWQSRHADAEVPPEVQELTLEPFGMTVADVIDYRASLGYQYEGVAAPRAVAPEARVAAVRRERVSSPVELDAQGVGKVGRRPPDHRRVRLRLHDIEMSEDSYIIDIFVNPPSANVSRRRLGDPHFAGSFAIFGAGPGGMPHTAGMHPVPRKHQPQLVDITAAVERIVPPGEEIRIQLAAWSSRGQVKLDEVPCGHVSIEILGESL
jgi:hypothetical protein